PLQQERGLETVQGVATSVVGRRRRPVGEPAGLVLDVLGNFTELVAVLAGVVRAEEKLAAALELYPEIGLGATPVAPVDRGERCCAGGCRSSHVGPRSHSGNCFNDRFGKVFFSLFRLFSHNSQPRWMLPSRTCVPFAETVVLLTCPEQSLTR